MSLIEEIRGICERHKDTQDKDELFVLGILNVLMGVIYSDMLEEFGGMCFEFAKYGLEKVKWLQSSGE